jgi:hypothetical protein
MSTIVKNVAPGNSDVPINSFFEDWFQLFVARVDRPRNLRVYGLQIWNGEQFRSEAELDCVFYGILGIDRNQRHDFVDVLNTK